MTTPVIFRKDKTGKEIVAFFPTIPGSHEPDTCSSYATIGQHSSATRRYYTNFTYPALPDEYKDLLEEMISIGYDDLDICTRWTMHFDNVRLQELRDLYD